MEKGRHVAPAGLLLLASACAGTPAVIDRPVKEPAMTLTDLPPLFIRPAQDSAPDMLTSVTGKLSVAGPCVFITNEASRWLAIWPTGTKQQGTTLTLPSGKQLRVGDTITLDGGARDGSASSTFWGAPMPQECRGPFFVVNQQSK